MIKKNNFKIENKNILKKYVIIKINNSQHQ